MNIGQYPDPTHTLLHLSDTHLVGERRRLYGAIDSDANLARLLDRLRAAGTTLDGIILTGDLADAGAKDAYLRLRALIEPFAAEHNCPVVWVMGNHDDRGAFRTDLLGEASDTNPVDRVHEINGLRIIALDSTVPGHHHGGFDRDQLEWLRLQLATPSRHGTLLALHHPPIPTVLPLLQLVELRDVASLAEVIRGTDVRGIIAGHFHYSTHSVFAGVPVSVAAATCYTQDLAVPLGSTRAHDTAQSANLVHLYPEQIVHSAIPLEGGATVYEVSAEQAAGWMLAAQAGEQFATELLSS